MYRRFLVRGTLQPQKSILIGPRKYGEVMGYHLIMPLARSPERGERSTSSSSTVLINLGFVSSEAAESYRSLASSSPSSESSRPVKSELREFNGKEIIIEALIPAPQTVNWFTPENKPEQGDWVWADAQAMAQYVGGTEANVVPLLMDEIFGSYVLTCISCSFSFDLTCHPAFSEGNIGEANQRIAKGVPVGRAPVVTFRNQHTSYAVTWFVQALLAVLFIII
jgi:surfeit locus 1 family protein